MENIVVSIGANNKPTNPPSLNVIAQTCRVALKASTSYISGTPLVSKSDGITLAWVKFGRLTTMQEAQTQQYVAQFLNDKADSAVRVPSVYLAFQRDPYDYIVMGPLLPSRPGPVGGHRFFIDWKSSVTYRSVPELEAQINELPTPIPEYTEHEERVCFGPEVEAYGLRLCPADINRANFIADDEGRIVAVDFGVASFLPVSFFRMALCLASDQFARLIANLVQPPEPTDSTQFNGLLTAHYALVKFNNNNIGLPAARGIGNYQPEMA